VSQSLVLFDIDGTLLITGGATSRCIFAALEEVTGLPATGCRIVPGRLDQQLYADIARQCGVPDPAIYFDAYKQCYLSRLEKELAPAMPPIRVLPGVIALLHQLERREDVAFGLLTGNFRDAARLKVRMAGLDGFRFSICAFAEDGNERSDLVRTAHKRYLEMTGVPADRTVVVGDTPADIAMARATGCTVLAVATGTYSLAELAAEMPDAAVADLSRPEYLYSLLNG
jgi:phosphoglycolate phosphatase-like HAD superfamily hydrolase